MGWAREWERGREEEGGGEGEGGRERERAGKRGRFPGAAPQPTEPSWESAAAGRAEMLQGARSGPAAGLPGQRRRPDGGRHPKLVHWRRAGPAPHPDRCDDQPADQALLSTRTAQPANGRRVGLVLQHVRSSTLSFARSLHRSLFSANLRLAFARLLAHSGTRLLQVAHLLPP